VFVHQRIRHWYLCRGAVVGFGLKVRPPRANMEIGLSFAESILRLYRYAELSDTVVADIGASQRTTTFGRLECRVLIV